MCFYVAQSLSIKFNAPHDISKIIKIYISYNNNYITGFS
jgi:hypothetical protein